MKLFVNVDAARCDDEGVSGNVLDLAVLGVGYAVKEVKHSNGSSLVKKLKVENYGATCDKMIGNGANLLKGCGANYLKLDVVTLDR